MALLRPQPGPVPGPAIWRAGRPLVTAVIVVTNLLGVAAIILIADFVVPLAGLGPGSTLRRLNLELAVAYVVVAVPAGVAVGTSGLARLRRWLLQETDATTDDQRVVLRAPLRLFVLQIALWLAAAVIFGTVNGIKAGTTGARLGVTIALTGMSTAACAYLLTERVLRVTVARALDRSAPDRLGVPGVAARAVLAWALGTGVPVAGLVAIGVLGLTGSDISPRHLALAMVSLGSVALTVGLLAVGLAARATADPVDSVRRAMDRAQHGDFSVRVPVYDGTQVGRLQAGFNRMVVGLAERERIRDALGTYVDEDVAERILSEGTSLDGEEVEVTIMFVDVRGFTVFAEHRPARQVVAALNELFDRIVPLVHAHGGHVDKFIGDGVLAVFGAPRRLPDHASQALAAAIAIAEATASGDLSVGIGLNSGTVVAGNVGGAGRYEFGVIGDVVNTAARVEAATRQTGDAVLIGESTAALLRISGAIVDDGRHTPPLAPPVVLQERLGATLKGKRKAVTLYAPVPASASEPQETHAPAGMPEAAGMPETAGMPEAARMPETSGAVEPSSDRAGPRQARTDETAAPGASAAGADPGG